MLITKYDTICKIDTIFIIFALKHKKNIMKTDLLRRDINRNFVIRITENDTKNSSLVGVTTFRALFPTTVKANQVLNKALNYQGQNYQLKLRRGITIVFHRK